MENGLKSKNGNDGDEDPELEGIFFALFICLHFRRADLR